MLLHAKNTRFFPVVLLLVILALSISTSFVHAQDPVTITIMVDNWDIFDEEITAFEAANPNIRVERLSEDSTRLNAMFAAGNPPDLIRISGSDVANMVQRGLLLDLTPYFAVSEVLRPDDLMATPMQYWQVQDGVYGMNRDWSPDQSVWINTAAFEEAGIPIPDPAVIPTYAQIGEWARALTVLRGERTVRMGWDNWFNDAVLQSILMEQGQDLYSEDFRQAIIKDNPLVVDVLRYFADLSKENVIWNPLNPSQLGPDVDLLQGTLGGATWGYWFHGAVAESTDSTVPAEDLLFLRGPSWGGETAVNIPFGGSGMAITAASQHPDEAWKLFEYHMGGQPAVDRAASGWGVPVLQSLLPLMPQETAFDQQTFAVLQAELADMTGEVRRINPYMPPNAFNESWTTNLELYLRDEITFDQLVENVDAGVNEAIQTALASQ